MVKTPESLVSILWNSVWHNKKKQQTHTAPATWSLNSSVKVSELKNKQRKSLFYSDHSHCAGALYLIQDIS